MAMSSKSLWQNRPIDEQPKYRMYEGKKGKTHPSSHEAFRRSGINMEHSYFLRAWPHNSFNLKKERSKQRKRKEEKVHYHLEGKEP